MEFVRITQPELMRLIPRKYFEQIEELDSEKIDRIYQYASSILTQVVPNELGQLERRANPLTWIAIVVDESRPIGFLWLDFDVIDESIFIQFLSIDKEYQNNGTMKAVQDYIYGLPELQVPENYKNKVSWLTTRPKAYERHGWKKDKRVLITHCRS